MKQRINSSWNKKYGKLAVITIAAVYLLILVGGIVRSTGSGMGCPDWPKCFGSYVPPTTIDELPSNYKDIYAEKRNEKNQRLAKLLDAVGADNLAEKIRNDKSILVEADFNPVKTWIEYINRIIGVIIGFLILGVFILSFSFIKVDKRVFFVSLGAFILLVFQAWIGSVVVSTNLLTWMVTLHMLLALVIVLLLIYGAFTAQNNRIHFILGAMKKRLQILLPIIIVLSVVQVVVGTQVREVVDQVAVANNFENREGWIEQIGGVFYIHRSYSIIILLLHVYLFSSVRKFAREFKPLYVWTSILLAVVILEILTGVIMAYFAIPPYLQPVHLLFGSLLFGIQSYILLLVNNTKRDSTQDLNLKECTLQEAVR